MLRQQREYEDNKERKSVIIQKELPYLSTWTINVIHKCVNQNKKSTFLSVFVNWRIKRHKKNIENRPQSIQNNWFTTTSQSFCVKISNAIFSKDVKVCVSEIKWHGLVRIICIVFRKFFVFISLVKMELKFHCIQRWRRRRMEYEMNFCVVNTQRYTIPSKVHSKYTWHIISGCHDCSSLKIVYLSSVQLINAQTKL